MINYKEGFPPLFFRKRKGFSLTFYLNTNTKQSHVDKVDTPFICHLQKKKKMKVLNLTNQKLEQTFYHYLTQDCFEQDETKGSS